MDKEARRRGLLDRWSHLENARGRTPCPSEAVCIIVEQLQIQEELHKLGTDVHAARTASH